MEAAQWARIVRNKTLIERLRADHIHKPTVRSSERQLFPPEAKNNVKTFSVYYTEPRDITTVDKLGKD